MLGCYRLLPGEADSALRPLVAGWWLEGRGRGGRGRSCRRRARGSFRRSIVQREGRSAGSGHVSATATAPATAINARRRSTGSGSRGGCVGDMTLVFLFSLLTSSHMYVCMYMDGINPKRQLYFTLKLLSAASSPGTQRSVTETHAYPSSQSSSINVYVSGCVHVSMIGRRCVYVSMAQ